MKKLNYVLILFFALAATSLQAQNQSTIKLDKEIKHITGDRYEVAFKKECGTILKKGSYLKMNDELKPHGIWKLYDYNTFDLVTTSKFDKGVQLWVETTVDGKTIRLYKQDPNKDNKVIALKNDSDTFQN